jgi:hypothetical protein
MSSRNTSIRFTLERIQNEVRQEKFKASTSASSTRMGDPQKEAFWRRLGNYEADLRRIHAELTGRLSSLQNERTHLWNAPRDQRWSARQSVDDREVVTQSLVEMAAAILVDLLSLYGDVSSMKPNDWEKVFQELVEFGDKVDKAVFHKAVQAVPSGPAIVVPRQGTFSLVDFAPLIGLLAAILAKKIGRRR